MPPAPNFNSIAPVYDLLAGVVFGQAQRRAENHFLSHVSEKAQVLVIGGGSGRILGELLKATIPFKVLYLETSAKMLQLAQKRAVQAEWAGAVEFRLGSEKELQTGEHFDVIITPFVFDLYPEAEALKMFQRLDQALVPDGLWLHTDFSLADSPRRRIWQKPMLWGMYQFFGVVSGVKARELPTVERMFLKANYSGLDNAFFYRSFIRTTLYQKPPAIL